MPCVLNLLLSSSSKSSTIFLASLVFSALNITISSNLLRSSGLKVLRNSSIRSDFIALYACSELLLLFCCPPDEKPSTLSLLISSAPIFEVRITMVFLKLTLLPLPSVR